MTERRFASRLRSAVIMVSSVQCAVMLTEPAGEIWFRIALAIYSLVIALILMERMAEAGWLDNSDSVPTRDIEFVSAEDEP